MRGQPDTPTPAAYRRGGGAALRDGRTGYPDNQGEPALRRAVAEKLQREQGLSYDPDREILITDGATLGVCAALGALVDGERTSCCPIRFTMPMTRRSLFGAAVRRPSPPTSATAGSRFGRRQLESSWVTGTDVILLNTPWNPVGTVLTRRGARGVMGFAQKHDSWSSATRSTSR